MKAWWIGLGLVAATVVTLVIVGATVTLGEVMQQTAGGIDIRVDGERVFGIGAGEMAGWATLAAALAALALLVIVPVSVLAEDDFPVELDRYYRMELTASGNRLTGKVDGKVVLEASDDEEPLVSGGVGLVVSDGTISTDAVTVSPVAA